MSASQSTNLETVRQSLAQQCGAALLVQCSYSVRAATGTRCQAGNSLIRSKESIPLRKREKKKKKLLVSHFLHYVPGLFHGKGDRRTDGPS